MRGVDLTITMPVYNVERYLRESINSVLHSDWADYSYELIIVDDGSTDGSSKILEEYKGFPQIHIVRQENQGLISAREHAVSLANGRYITFLDSDDWVSHDYFLTLLNFCIENDLDIAVGSFLEAFQNIEMPVIQQNQSVILSREDALMELFVWNFFRWELWSKIYRRDCIQDIVIEREIRSGEDCIRNFYAFQRARRIGYTPIYGYHYRQRSSSMTKDGIQRSYESTLSYVLESISSEALEMSAAIRDVFLTKKIIFAISALDQENLSLAAREKIKSDLIKDRRMYPKNILTSSDIPALIKLKYILLYCPAGLGHSVHKFYRMLRMNRCNKIRYS